jgi:hypothetical protein
MLHIIIWPRHRIDRIANKLADTSRPVDALEASKASIAYQMRDIRYSSEKKDGQSATQRNNRK